MRLFGYAPERGAAAGDTMPFHHDGKWHLFFSQPPVAAWEYVERARVSTAYLRSDDLVNWEVMPDAFGPGAHGDCDGDGIWTGSVIEHEGVFHFFYTGYNRQSASPQTICKATSVDLRDWAKSGANPMISPDPRWYETVDWRDPFVYRDDEAGCFKMLISARLKEGPQFRRGCIAVATSDDLENWEVGPPLASSMLTHCPECPEIFKMGDWWYLVESRYSERMQTVYRVAKSPDGPWESRKLDSLDGRRFYAAKSASDGRRRITFAWIPFRKHHDPKGNWVWGGELGSPRELVSLSDGTLISRLPQDVDNSYAVTVPHELHPMLGDWTREESPRCDATGSYGYAFLGGPDRDDVLLDLVIEPDPNTESVGILVESCGGDHLDSGYSLAIEPMKERVLFDRWPAAMDPLWDSLVLKERHGIEVRQEIDSPLAERPLAFTPEDGRYRVQILRKGSAIECFVAGQVVASFRIDDMPNADAWGLFVQEGAARFHDLKFRK
ncbi:MAG: family 43 glycosylhydrolase [Boseongicola sp. SB0677_bin_26]|nr:family 43 glycosylhydrolase [Boseongicola sp. SB0665_bin_10]MYG25262.1 family 43 glycosylhydrolase [Boseongicola sp. SB0677_bin_26]